MFLKNYGRWSVEKPGMGKLYIALKNKKTSNSENQN
jgi:hypothetical protein